jgi:transaldolase
MKIYLDSGNIEEIREAVSTGLIEGVTTNPSLVKSKGKYFFNFLKEVCKLFKKKGSNFTVSAEVVGDSAEEMYKQGLILSKIDSHMVVKVPVTFEGLKAVQLLRKRGIKTNVTLCFSTNQAILAAKSGAYFISPFVGRLEDINIDGVELIKEIKEIYTKYNFKTEILAASIRSVRHITNVAMAGADIATIPYPIFKKMLDHPLTSSGIKKFEEDWSK